MSKQIEPSWPVMRQNDLSHPSDVYTQGRDHPVIAAMRSDVGGPADHDSQRVEDRVKQALRDVGLQRWFDAEGRSLEFHFTFWFEEDTRVMKPTPRPSLP